MFNPFKKQPVAPQEKFVSCETCSHLVRERDAKKVEVDRGYLGGMSFDFYCPEHKPLYDEEFRVGGFSTYYKNIPAHKVEVTKEGKPVK